MEQLDPGLAGRGGGRQSAVVAEHHQRLVAQVSDQPLALVEPQGGALVVVIGQVRQHDEGMLGERQEPLRLGRDGHALVRVDVDDEFRVFAGAVDGGMDHETRGVDAVGAVDDDVPFQVHLHQR